ncbi:MAG: PD-(D/E)XK nuclease family protein, partial [Magnetococcales bacterium]|nr:PD-(D/E)XK nuclease family protein [Magnetococcales bacterium]
MRDSLPLEAALEALTRPETVLLTANRRLARHLRREFDARREQAGERLWETPQILPLGSWLSQQWDEWLDDAPPSGGPLLLTEWQETWLWERLVARSREGSELLDPTGAAQLAREAWTLLHQWHLPLDAPEFDHSPESRAFRTWALRFQQQCAQRGWESPALLPDRLGRLPRLPRPPERVLLAGFDRIPPQSRQLWDALEAQGIPVHAVSFPPQRGSVARLAVADETEEMRLAARWCRNLLEQNPGAAIGVVVPNLEARRERIERMFSAVFRPALALSPESRPLLHLSLGPPLASRPVIRDLLALLELAADRLPADRLSLLLRSPFWGGDEAEGERRALLEARLRDQGRFAPDRDELRHAAANGLGWPEAASPALARALGDLAAGGRLPAAGAAAWAERFSQWAAALGWPGPRGLDSAERQAVDAWKSTLGEFAKLELTAGSMPLAEALAWLRRIAASTPFQTEGSDEAVQVMGPLETAGERFDALWILGLSHAAWPAAARPNPYLPLPLQRRLGLPRATPEGETAFARDVTARLADSAPQVIASHPLVEEDRPSRVNPLITHWPALPPEAL